jgi:uncharacterized protein YndB with AHSA1/START domain
MTERSVTHTTFVIEREYDASRERVFAAWADPSSKARWFGGDDFELDFRVGGREINRGRVGDAGPLYTYACVYADIVPDERIVYTYEMHMDDARISVSLSTIQFEDSGSGTKLVYTEQGAYLDGLDSAEQREEGTRTIFDALARELAGQPVN